MPWYLYRIHRVGALERVEERPTFPAASKRAKELRADPALPAGCTVKVVFAATEAEAEELLTRERAPRPGLDGDE